jgi:hypothetical protein
MKTSAEVTGVRKLNCLGTDRQVVTLKMWLGGELELNLTAHEAKPYTLGRTVVISLEPERAARRGRR